MIIEVKYRVGDVVQYIKEEIHNDVVECPCCGGEGQIVGKDGNKYDCPYCNGGLEDINKEVIREVKKVSKIKRVHVYYLSVKENDGVMPIITYWLENGDTTFQENIVEQVNNDL